MCGLIGHQQVLLMSSNKTKQPTGGAVGDVNHVYRVRGHMETLAL